MRDAHAPRAVPTPDVLQGDPPPESGPARSRKISRATKPSAGSASKLSLAAATVHPKMHRRSLELGRTLGPKSVDSTGAERQSRDPPTVSSTRCSEEPARISSTIDSLTLAARPKMNRGHEAHVDPFRWIRDGSATGRVRPAKVVRFLGEPPRLHHPRPHQDHRETPTRDPKGSRPRSLVDRGSAHENNSSARESGGAPKPKGSSRHRPTRDLVDLTGAVAGPRRPRSLRAHEPPAASSELLG